MPRNLDSGQYGRLIALAIDRRDFDRCRLLIRQAEGQFRSRGRRRPQAELLAESLASLGVPDRIANILAAAGIETVRRYLDCHHDVLMEIPNFRDGSMRSVDAALLTAGVDLAYRRQQPATVH